MRPRQVSGLLARLRLLSQKRLTGSDDHLRGAAVSLARERWLRRLEAGPLIWFARAQAMNPP
jgi:hypothetical protein